MNAPSSVLLAGAGIGGLTTLLALHSHGIRATAVDRAAILAPVGVGINLQPVAVRELHRLGLGAGLDAISLAAQHLEFYDPHGELLWREPLGLVGGYDYPQCSVHRGQLQMLLLDAVAERLGEHAVVADTALIDIVDQSDTGMRVRTSRGDRHPAIVVGADGVHSVVRRLLHAPDDDPILYSGTWMYRGATPMPALLDGATMVIVKTGHGVELVLYPLVGGLLNWVLLIPEHHDAGDDLNWDHPVDRDHLCAQVQDWSLSWLDPTALISATETITSHPMVDREPLSWWGRGPVTLLGDAAHPMYPVGANGGSQTIVDAAVLAQCLAGDPVNGLRAYENRRIPMTAEVVHANRERHRSDPYQQGEAAARYRTQTHADHDPTAHRAM